MSTRPGTLRSPPTSRQADQRTRFLHRGQIIQLPTNGCGGLFLVVEGFVQVASVDDDGREVTLALVGPGHFVGRAAALGGMDADFHLKTLSDTVLNTISAASLEEGLRSYGSARFVIESLAVRLRQAQRFSVLRGYPSIARRLTCLFDLLGEEFGERNGGDAVSIGIPLAHQDLARMVSCTRPAVSRHLTSLKHQGIIDWRGRNHGFLYRPQLAGRLLWGLRADQATA